MSNTIKAPRHTRLATGIAQVLLAFMLLSASVILFMDVGYAVKGPTIQLDVKLTGQELKGVPGPPLPPGAEYTGSAGVRRLTTPPLPLGSRLFAVAGTALFDLAALLGALSSAFLVAAIGAGDPFGPRNARRVGLIGACVLAGGVAAPWLSWWGKREALGAIGMDPNVFSHVTVREVAYSSTSGMALLAGLIVVAAAQVFSRGRQLNEQSTTPE